MPTLGEHIREQRLTNGLSLGQLASKLGLTAAVVRSWERDQGVPDDGQLASLADVLEDDLEALTSLAPVAAPVETPERVEAPDALDTPAEPVPEPEPPAVTAAVAVDDVVDVVVVTEPEPQQPDDAEAVPPSEDGSEDLVAADVEADVDEVDLAQAEEAVVVAAGADADEDSTSSSSGDAQETEQVAMDEVMAAAAGVEDAAVEPGGRRSFLEYWRDPEQRLRYYLRWIATAAVMLVLALVLVWAVGELLDAIGQVTDQFGTQEVDEFESLRS